MSDLIRRDDAIDALVNLTCYGIEEMRNLCEASVADSEGWLGGIRDAVDEIEALPSAESEPEEFEWCTDCKEYDQEKHCCHRWTKVIRQTVDELKSAEPERKKGKWIDGMPYVNSHWKVCSECHVSAPDSCGGFNYCPNCGAEMTR